MTTPRFPLAAALCLLLLAAPGAHAQTSRADPSDLNVWLGTGLKLDLPARWEASVDYRLRLVDNASVYRGSYLTAEAGRNVGSHFFLFANYRLALVNDGTYHRTAMGAEFDTRVGPATLAFRQILQYQHQIFADDPDQSSDDDVLARSRFEAKYPLTERFGIYGSVEPYFRFGADYPVDNWRNTVGLRFEFADGRTAKLFYIYRPDYAKSYNRTFHIIGFDLDFDVKLGGKANSDTASR